MISLTNLKKSYLIGGEETFILKGVDLTIKNGEFVAIMGPSGSGKSTLMNMIGILDNPTSGSYSFEDQETATLDQDQQALFRREKIGFIFQGYNLLPRIPARQQVALPLSYAGVERSLRFEKAKRVLERVGLGEKINHTPDMLSGGQQQRVCIARALINDPVLLLADEPTGALDSVTSADVLTLFTELNNQGRTIIMITHDQEVAQYASRTIRIKDGKIEENT